VIDRLTRRFGAWLMAAMSTPRAVNIRAVRITAHSPQRTASRLAAVAAAADASDAVDGVWSGDLGGGVPGGGGVGGGAAVELEQLAS
jgi:hypothetical protein